MAVFQGRQTIHRSEFADSERNMTVYFPPDRSTLTFFEGINKWREMLTNDRKAIGDFACWLHALIGISMR
jgi:hypothetical protein